MGVPGSQREELGGSAGLFQLVKLAQLKGGHPHSVVDVIDDIVADRHAVGVWGKLHRGDLREVQDLRDEWIEG